MGEAQPNVQHNGENFERQLKKKYIRWIDNHAPALAFAQDLKHTQFKSKGKLEMMLEKEQSCNLFTIFFLN
jgi:hypothetical protein